MAGKEAEFRVAMRPGRCRALSETPDGRLQELIETAKAHIRSKVEHPFRVIKQQFGFHKTRLSGLALPKPQAERGGATRTAARSRSWQRCRTRFRSDGNCSQQPDQGIGIDELRDSVSKISPKRLNRRTKALRKRHQKHLSGKGTLTSLLLPLSPRLPRVSLMI